MAQVTTQTAPNSAGATYRTNVNNIFGALFSSSSGATAPTVTVAGQPWFDTTAGVLKVRDAANAAWITVGVTDYATLAEAKAGTLTNKAINPSTLQNAAQPQLASWDWSSNVASVPLTGLAGWDEIVIIGSSLTHSVANPTLGFRVSVDNGSNWRTTGYVGESFSSGTSSGFTTQLPFIFSGGAPQDFRCVISGLGLVNIKTQSALQAAEGSNCSAFGRYNTDEVHNAVQLVSSANITAGRIRVYGVRRA
jgi:hypothetical protein